MNRQFAKGVLRDNWHLTVLLVGLLGTGAYFQLGYRETPPSSKNASAIESEASVQAPLSDQAPDRPSPQDHARTTIADYKAKFQENPADKDAPVFLSAMGNLYRYKLNDYPNAIQAYQLLLHDYPNWEGNRNTLIALATCYEHTGNREGVRDVYEMMLKQCPPESQEYQYAKAQLSH